MKLYFEYIAENESVFKRFQLHILFGVIILLVILIASLYGRNPELYKNYSGEVKSVKLGKVKVKPSGIKDSRQWKYQEAINIQIDQNLFVFYGGQYDVKKMIVMNELKVGDYIKVTHRRLDWNEVIFEIEKNGTLLLEREKYREKWAFIFVYLPPLIIAILILIYYWTYNYRKQFISKKK
jgi:hypothetical protein